MTAYFITATGTGIGKTFTTCALLHAMPQAHGFKPIISGWDDADQQSDTRQIIAASSASPAGEATRLSASALSRSGEGAVDGAVQKKNISKPEHADTRPHPDFLSAEEALSKSDLSRGRGGAEALLEQKIETISPWRFTAPLSPHRAAALENKFIDTNELVNWTRAQTQGEGLQLIETVGGVMVPLTDHYTTLDWMAAANLPIILITGSYLGTISHTLTALAALRARNLKVAAIILNETPGSAVTLAETESGLAPFIADIPLRATQPLVSSYRAATAIHALKGAL